MLQTRRQEGSHTYQFDAVGVDAFVKRMSAQCMHNEPLWLHSSVAVLILLSATHQDDATALRRTVVAL